LSSEKKSPTERAATFIRELEMRKLQDAEKYEECETIARLSPQEVIDLIDDPEVKEAITWLKKAHRDIPSLAKWRKAFAQTTKLLFKEAGGIDRIKKWHELEAVCDKISEEELKNLDKNLREAVTWVQHIHDHSPERRLKIIRRINSEANHF